MTLPMTREWKEWCSYSTLKIRLISCLLRPQLTSVPEQAQGQASHMSRNTAWTRMQLWQTKEIRSHGLMWPARQELNAVQEEGHA